MRLASFHTAAQGASYGAVTDKGIVDLRRYLGNQFPDLKALMDCPNDFATSGIRLAPNRTSTTTRMTRSSGAPKLNILIHLLAFAVSNASAISIAYA